jgi:hypothetical protein
MEINDCMTEIQTELLCEQLSRYCMSMLNLLYYYMLVDCSLQLHVHCNCNLSNLKYANLEPAVATWLLQDMHIHSDKPNATSSCLGTV